MHLKVKGSNLDEKKPLASAFKWQTWFMLIGSLSDTFTPLLNSRILFLRHPMNQNICILAFCIWKRNIIIQINQCIKSRSECCSWSVLTFLSVWKERTARAIPVLSLPICTFIIKRIFIVLFFCKHFTSSSTFKKSDSVQPDLASYVQQRLKDCYKSMLWTRQSGALREPCVRASVRSAHTVPGPLLQAC